MVGGADGGGGGGAEVGGALALEPALEELLHLLAQAA